MFDEKIETFEVDFERQNGKKVVIKGTEVF